MTFRAVFHSVYYFFGLLLNRGCRCWWNLRDFWVPPRENAVLFVAHPDDDTLFFHTFIKKYHPYVVLLTTGWSWRRFFCFCKVMKLYGVRYRAYDLLSRDTRTEKLSKHIKEANSKGNFIICATHNAEGEYGHEMHKRVHEAVISQIKCPIYVPISEEKLIDHPLSTACYQEKKSIFEKYYKTELFVLEQYRSWVEHEQLVQHNC